MKKFFKVLLTVILAVAILVGGFVGYLAITEYKPKDITPVQLLNQQGKILSMGDELSITSFNIGYAALDRETDFFMDGGTMSKGISQERVQDNLDKIGVFLRDQNSDIYLVQEVDERSSRSYFVDQRRGISATLGEDYSSSFAINYQVGWVPIPLREPMGKVLSGILTLTRFGVDETTRYSLPGEYAWPTRLAQLDRCLLETRIPLTDGTKLVIGHIHLSAFDEGGFIRNQQLAFLEDYARTEFNQGNYVVIGGDWNHLLSEKPEEFRARNSANWPFWLQILPQNFLPEFQWAFDEKVPSNRTMDAPYNPKTTFVSTIDGFLVSPNIRILDVQGHDLNFEFSDHNPVTVRLRLGDAPEAETDVEQPQEEGHQEDANNDINQDPSEVIQVEASND